MSEFIIPDINTDDPLLKSISEGTEHVEFTTFPVSEEIRHAIEPPVIVPEDDITPTEDYDSPDDEPEETPLPDATHKGMAEGIVGTANNIAQSMLPGAYKPKFFKHPIDVERGKKLKRMAENGHTFDDEDEAILNAYIEFHDLCDQIPMTPDMKRAMVEPLSEILAQHGGEMSPEMRLGIAVLGWAFPLSLPFFTKKNNY